MKENWKIIHSVEKNGLFKITTFKNISFQKGTYFLAIIRTLTIKNIICAKINFSPLCVKINTPEINQCRMREIQSVRKFV